MEPPQQPQEPPRSQPPPRSGGTAPRGRRSALLAGLAALVVVAVALTLVLTRGAGPGAGPPPGTSVSPAAPGTVPVPAHGIYFGIYTNPSDGGRQAAIVRLERLVGRPFAIDHQYYRWDQPFPDGYLSWTAARGRIPLVNWQSQTLAGGQVPWAQIAAGGQDAVIDARARAVRAFGRPIMISFQHEPTRFAGSGPGKDGTPAAYRAAWRHIVARFRALGVANVSWVWIMTASSFRAHAGRVADPSAFYPGDDVIDWVAADGYNSYGCPGHPGGWRSFRQIFTPFYAWALPHHKPLMVAEWGSDEDPAQPGRKGDWFVQAGQQLAGMPAIKAVVYFNSAPGCPNWVTSSASALAGFRRLATESALRPAGVG